MIRRWIERGVIFELFPSLKSSISNTREAGILRRTLENLWREEQDEYDSDRQMETTHGTLLRENRVGDTDPKT